MRLAAPVPILVASLVAAAACDDGPANVPTDAGLEQFQLHAEPDPELNATAQILNGPFLSAPGEGTMTVSWHTEVPSSSVVSFGLQGEAQQEVTGIVFEQMPTSPEPILWGVSPKGYMHEVTLTGLTPGATYTYQVLSVASPVGGTFTAPPTSGEPFSFVVFGDSRTGHENHQRVIDGIVDYADAHRWPVFLINTGDMTGTGGNEDEWALHFGIEAPVIANAATLPTFGNHDHKLGRTYFEHFFKSPPANTSMSERFYSARVGDVHFLTIDMYSLISEPHLDWMEDEFVGSDAPYKIASVHEPLITYSSHLPPFEWRDEILPRLEAGGVQLVVAGHNHCYERFVGYGAYWVTAGGGGAPLYDPDANLEVDNGEAQRHAAGRYFHFVWADVTPEHMTLRTIAGDDGTAPVDTETDCFRILPNQPVSAAIDCP